MDGLLDLVAHYSDQALAILPPEWLAVLVAIGAALKALALFFGTCSMVVVPLRALVERAIPWAERTETNVDNALLGIVATSLATVAPALEKARNWCEHAALNRLFAGKK